MVGAHVAALATHRRPGLIRFWHVGTFGDYEDAVGAQASLMKLAESEWLSLMNRSGTRTMLRENGLVKPKTPGVLRLDTPAGLVVAAYRQEGEYVEEVRITNVPSFLYVEGLTVECPTLGKIKVDVAYGGNFYVVVEPQENYNDMADCSAGDLIAWSPVVRRRLNEKYTFEHPENPALNRLSHMLWTGKPKYAEADARNAVFYGDKAIDRSPCGTGTSARIAQLHAKGRLKAGDSFVHESIIGSLFKGRVEEETSAGSRLAIVPSIGGWASQTGFNMIFIDDRDPFAHGFVVQ